MRDLLVTLIVFGSIPFIFKRPYIGLLMYCWVSYMNPHRLTWGFAYDMPFAALLAAVTIFAMLFSKESKGVPVTGITIVWAMWIIWMNVTTVFAMSPVPSDVHFEWERSMKIQLMAIVTMMLITSPQKIKLLTLVLALSVGFYGIKGGFFALVTGGNFLIWGPPGTFFEGNNGLAFALVMILPLMYFLQSYAKNKWLRYGYIAAMGLMGISILASYSRGAFLGVAAVMVYMVLKSRKKALMLPMVIVGAILALSFMPQKWYDRINTIQTYEEDGSALGRINAWYFAFNIAKERPLIGGGFSVFNKQLFASYAPDPEDFHDAHSIYFESLGEQGFVGLALFLTLLFLVFREAQHIRKLTRGKENLKWAFDLASMAQASLVGYAVAGSFVGMAYFDLYYHIICIVVLTRQAVDESLKNELAGEAEQAKENEKISVAQ